MMALFATRFDSVKDRQVRIEHDAFAAQ